MKRPVNGRGLFHTRDSGGKHEMTPAKYVEWALAEAQKLGVRFTGTPAQIKAMIREGKFADGDLFIDFDVPGNVLSRPGLHAMQAEICRDMTVSHVFIPNRDRLARPDDPLDGVRLENGLRTAGVTVVFMDRVGLPILRGSRQNFGDLVVSLIDYEKAGAFRQELARRIILAQIALAQAGFSTGGRAPFGFRRWLVRVDGTPVRELADRERVRMVGHHVVWLPGPRAELDLIRRIVTMLKTMAASRVAAVLNEERIPSPDAGRYRTDNGVRHEVSGLWHQPTITNIARNRLLVVVATHGQRSMGDQLRMTPEGPRSLSEGDYRANNEPKVIRNPKTQHITAKSASPFEPVVDQQKFDELQEILDLRAGSQRGKPRSRDPRRNPLGGRVFDMNCGWVMYRVPNADSFRYKCGLYQQSHGQRCDHNHIDGPLATRFVLGCLRQRLLSPNLVTKLKTRLAQLAAAELEQDRPQGRGSASRTELDQVRRELKLAERNLALAENENQFRAIAGIVEELRQREASLELATKSAPARTPRDVNSEIEAAVQLAGRLVEIGRDAQNLALAREAIDLANANLFLRFQPIRAIKRTMNKIAGGVVTLGTAPPPVALYDGPTSRDKIKNTNLGAANAVPEQSGRRSPTESEAQDSGREGTSLGNVNRGDRI
ncbi:MAG TPA: recombinase family protein [Planctomycetaceae bacterium]|jgi:hypothetical protein|nr:recombinase family protein [Planctomycetaceae bacterium]